MDAVDPILERVHRQLPSMVPRYGKRWEQYLLSWQPVTEDLSGSLRRTLHTLRHDLRQELGLSSRDEKSDADSGISVEHLWFLYEKNYIGENGFHVEKYLADRQADFGGVDAVCLWQSYPRLGLDHRNQFDYYRDLPGGLPELTRVVRVLHASEVKVFLNYNPWDSGTRREGGSDADTIAGFLETTGADGVFLDTIEGVDRTLLERLRKTRTDVAVCPELIPPLSDLAAIGGSWQQFATPIPPSVLFHKWLDPRFRLRLVDRASRDRVEQLSAGFLHGTGQVVWENVFGWWNPWSDAERLLLKRTTSILRTFDDFFRDPDWEPYVPTGHAGVHAMEWHCGDAVLYTLFNGTAESCHDVEITLPEKSGSGLFDLWHGRELFRSKGGRTFTCSLAAGEVGCVVAGSTPRDLVLPEDSGDSRRHRPVTLSAYRRREAPRSLTVGRRKDGGDRDMVGIGAERYVMKVRRSCDPLMEGGTYADISAPTAKAVPDRSFRLSDYAIDRAPVTKASFQEFLQASGYRPPNLDNFLRDWLRPAGSEKEPDSWAPAKDKRSHPVTWVSLDDARAYAAWARMTLPTEAQWQRAAEGPHGNTWPWGDAFDPSRCNGDSSDTTPVDAFQQGASADGCLDMCGNVWEWTESERDDGHTRYVMVRGGCHLRVLGSPWYTASGPQPCNVHEKVPLLGGGIDRLSTVGFRCVRQPPG